MSLLPINCARGSRGTSQVGGNVEDHCSSGEYRTGRKSPGRTGWAPDPERLETRTSRGDHAVKLAGTKRTADSCSEIAPTDVVNQTHRCGLVAATACDSNCRYRPWASFPILIGPQSDAGNGLDVCSAFLRNQPGIASFSLRKLGNCHIRQENPELTNLLSDAGAEYDRLLGPHPNLDPASRHFRILFLPHKIGVW